MEGFFIEKLIIILFVYLHYITNKIIGFWFQGYRKFCFGYLILECKWKITLKPYPFRLTSESSNTVSDKRVEFAKIKLHINPKTTFENDCNQRVA